MGAEKGGSTGRVQEWQYRGTYLLARTLTWKLHRTPVCPFWCNSIIGTSRTSRGEGKLLDKPIPAVVLSVFGLPLSCSPPPAKSSNNQTRRSLLKVDLGLALFEVLSWLSRPVPHSVILSLQFKFPSHFAIHQQGYGRSLFSGLGNTITTTTTTYLIATGELSPSILLSLS